MATAEPMADCRKPFSITNAEKQIRCNYQSKKIGCKVEIRFSTFASAPMISMSTYNTLHLFIDNTDMLFEKKLTTKSNLIELNHDQCPQFTNSRQVIVFLACQLQPENTSHGP